jgi:hypothetical protein
MNENVFSNRFHNVDFKFIYKSKTRSVSSLLTDLFYEKSFVYNLIILQEYCQQKYF